MIVGPTNAGDLSACERVAKLLGGLGPKIVLSGLRSTVDWTPQS